MKNTKEIKIPESVYNHLNYIRNSDGKIKFLELYFNIKLRWYQKVYLKMYLLFSQNEMEQFSRFFRLMKLNNRRKHEITYQRQGKRQNNANDLYQ